MNKRLPNKTRALSKQIVVECLQFRFKKEEDEEFFQHEFYNDKL